jgi:hypothetical protein
MAKSKERTVTGAYSDENFNDGSKDKIRNVDWGPVEGNKTPPVLDVSGLDSDSYSDIGTKGFSGPIKVQKGKVQRKDWQ